MTNNLVADLGVIRDVRTVTTALSAERVRRGISQLGLARRLHIQRSAVAGQEFRGMSTLATLVAYANALDLEIRVSLHRKDTP